MENQTIGQLAAQDFGLCDIFDRYKIDYYNKGKQTLRAAAEGRNIKSHELLAEITEAQKSKSASYPDFISLPLDELTGHIVENYHRPAERRIGELKPLLENWVEDHIRSFLQAAEVKDLFDQVAGRIAMHQRKEELILFPYIRKMTAAKRGNKPFIKPPMTKSAENPVNMLTHEHYDQGEAFERIAELTQDYTTGQDSTELTQKVYTLLKDFEYHLHRHLHLENNILFPKALELDKEMSA